MTESSQLTKLSANTRKLAQLINKIVEHRKDIARSMRTLKAKGLICANPHWRNERYLYLLYPVVTGQPRKREYIGTNPARIDAAKQAITRAHQYDELTSRLHRMDAAIGRASKSVALAIDELRKW